MEGSWGFVWGNDKNIALPPPLNAEEEAELLKNIKVSEEARKELAEHNLRLVVYLAKRFASSGVPMEDLVSFGCIGLLEAVNSFDPERGAKFSSYATRCIENRIIIYLRKQSHIRDEVSLETAVGVDGEGNELLLSNVFSAEETQVGDNLEADAERQVLHEVMESLSEKERNFLKWSFGLDGEDKLTQKEIGDKLGISQPVISRYRKKVLGKLKVEMRAKF